jgi:hypothetical protein
MNWFEISPSALLPVIVTIVGALAWNIFRMGKLAFQVETLWEFHVRRAYVEAVGKGWASVNSPIHITAAGFEAALPFLAKFLPFYLGMVKRHLSEPEMFFELEKHFGDEIMERICIPAQVSQGACLINIIQACQEAITKDLPIVKDIPTGGANGS